MRAKIEPGDRDPGDESDARPDWDDFIGEVPDPAGQGRIVPQADDGDVAEG
jgi:hypothetical protein